MKILKFVVIFILLTFYLNAQKVEINDSIYIISLNEVNVEGIRVSSDSIYIDSPRYATGLSILHININNEDIDLVIYSKADSKQDSIPGQSIIKSTIIKDSYKFNADDLRDRPNDRKKMFSYFKEILDRNKKPYSIINGSIKDRLSSCIKIINNL